MKKGNLEVGNAVYTGVCIYNRLRKSIVEIENEFVTLEDKIDLGLYLGVLHSKNNILPIRSIIFVTLQEEKKKKKASFLILFINVQLKFHITYRETTTSSV